MQKISKGAIEPSNALRRMFYFPSARSAFHAFMSALGISPASRILLPAYIGWSSREGSGVYDPVCQLNAQAIFYRVSARLDIDLDDAKRQIERHRPEIVVLIHYFGFPDPMAAALAEFARSRGIVVLEDEAHAMLTDLIGGGCGRLGDAALFSFHKLLPLPSGGALVLNKPIADHRERILERLAAPEPIPYYDYDLLSIANTRRRNAAAVLQHLADEGVPVLPIHATIPAGVVPQTVPVTLPIGLRDELYFRLNDMGLGVVSLYHTLIDAIDTGVHTDSLMLSKTILNLPVHQDTSDEPLRELAMSLKELILSRVTSKHGTVSAI